MVHDTHDVPITLMSGPGSFGKIPITIRCIEVYEDEYTQAGRIRPTVEKNVGASMRNWCLLLYAFHRGPFP